MPQFTGGQLYYYPSFKYDRDGERFARDLWRNVTRETGWEGVMRVRTSKGRAFFLECGFLMDF